MIMLMMLVIFAPNNDGQVDVDSFDDNDGDVMVMMMILTPASGSKTRVRGDQQGRRLEALTQFPFHQDLDQLSCSLSIMTTYVAK